MGEALSVIAVTLTWLTDQLCFEFSRIPSNWGTSSPTDQNELLVELVTLEARSRHRCSKPVQEYLLSRWLATPMAPEPGSEVSTSYSFQQFLKV